MTINRTASAGCFLILLSSVTATAQLTTDVVPQGRLVPRAQQIERDLALSRYRLGPFRIQPLFTLRDIGYSNNVFGTSEKPIADWSATVSAGGRWTLPFGPKMYFRGEALPEYTWFNKLAERRFLGGTYNASAVALFNRLSLEASGGTSKELSRLNSETEAPVIRRLSDVSVDSELDIFRRLSMFGRVQTQRLRYRPELGEIGELARIRELDRDDSVVRGGVRYRFSSTLNVSVASEVSRSEFAFEPESHDNESKAILLGVSYQRPRTYLNLTVGNREGKAIHQSSFRPYTTPTGSYFLSHLLVAPIEVQVHGQRKVQYGLFAANPYFFETRNGVTLIGAPKRRVALRGFAEFGENDYAASAVAGRKRLDKVVQFGGGVVIRVFRNMAFTAVVSQTRFDSNIDTFDRSVVRIQSGLTLRGD